MGRVKFWEPVATPNLHPRNQGVKPGGLRRRWHVPGKAKEPPYASRVHMQLLHASCTVSGTFCPAGDPRKTHSVVPAHCVFTELC